MPGDDGVAPQADLVGIPGAALNSLSFAQGLLRAVSADNVNPNAVIQVRAIGTCFQSNGSWAAKLPDLLSRTSSIRLERLSTWIGWAKDDTPSFISQTPGGRTAALLCCALGSLYPEVRCGFLLYELSRHLLPPEQQVSSPAQLGAVCMVLEGKIACLGFGNHLALHVTRLRQCFFEAEVQVPHDLVDTPTGEDMSVFLEKVCDALGDESLMLQVSGTRCVGTLLAVVLAMCPEDVSVVVNGEVLMNGCRENIAFSISNTPCPTTKLCIEKKLKVHADDFHKEHIITESRDEFIDRMSFSHDSILSSYLDLVLASVGADPNQPLKFSVANVIASVTSSFTGEDLRGRCDWRIGESFPDEGLRVTLGPTYQQIIPDRLEKVLCRPSGELQSPKREFETLQDVVSAALPLTHCKCSTCEKSPPWNEKSHPTRGKAEEKWQLCPVSRLWRAVGHVLQSSLFFLFIKASPQATLRFEKRFTYPNLPCFLWEYFKDQKTAFSSVTPPWLHESILNPIGSGIMRVQDGDHRLCSSSSTSTIYPSTLEYPGIINPWAVEYALADGRLHYHGDCYVSIVGAEYGKKGVQGLNRTRAKTSIMKGMVTAPSGVGEHNNLLMTLRPAIRGGRSLILRCQIMLANRVIEADFFDIHIGLMQLSPAKECQHPLSTPLKITASVKATSTIAPVAAGKGVIGITLTHRDKESQFLSCTTEVRQIYQGNCCMQCAITQAKQENYQVVIGGSLSIYHIIDSRSN